MVIRYNTTWFCYTGHTFSLGAHHIIKSDCQFTYTELPKKPVSLIFLHVWVERTDVHWIGSDCSEMESNGLEWTGMDWNGLEWTGIQCDGVNRSGLSWAGDNVMNECLMTHTQDKEQECMRWEQKGNELYLNAPLPSTWMPPSPQSLVHTRS